MFKHNGVTVKHYNAHCFNKNNYKNIQFYKNCKTHFASLATCSDIVYNKFYKSLPSSPTLNKIYD